MKAHKGCTVWNLLILSSFPYEKICIIVKMTTFLAQFIFLPPLAI